MVSPTPDAVLLDSINKTIRGRANIVSFTMYKINKINLDETVGVHGQVITIEDAMTRFNIESPIRRFGTWMVTTYGLECLTNPYQVTLDRFEEVDWYDHMERKKWCNLGDFMNALDFAVYLYKVRQRFTKFGDPLRVFLCHGSEDKPTVRQLRHQLTFIGIKSWLDEEDLLAGQDWGFEISKELNVCDAVLVCLSKTSISKSGFVQEEIDRALDVAEEKPEGSIFVIPTKLEDCKIPDRVNKWHGVNLYEDSGFDKLVASLYQRLRSLRT